MKQSRRIAAFVLAAAMVFSTLPMNALAAETQEAALGPCEHHPKHTADCGYAQAVPESPCTHTHSESCYTLVTQCVHTHDEGCAPAAVTDKAAAPAEEPGGCAHQCSEESDCVTKTLACTHQHDDQCGYAPGVAGQPCGFSCTVCNAQKQEEPAAPECICEMPCTAEAVNQECPVCGVENSDLTQCQGTPVPEEIVCTCTEACTAEAVNQECPVCGVENSDLTQCQGTPVPEEIVCTCTEACTAEAVNQDCPVCGVENSDLTQCQGTPAQEEIVCTCTEVCNAEAVNQDCPVCGAENADLTQCQGKAPDEQVKAVQALVDALPTAEEVEAMTAEEQQAVYEKLQAAYTAYNALTPEQKAQITGAEKLENLLAFFAGKTNALINGVKYLDASGSEQTADNVTVVASDMTAWQSGWYVVNSDVTIDSRVTVSGEVHLILTDGASLTVNGGIGVTEGNGFSLYAQSVGGNMGTLTATSSQFGEAGIGGKPGGSGGNITICGGGIEATSSKNGAGIGGGANGSGGTVTIYGGSITANSELHGAGIGGGSEGSGGNITIHGGSVTVTGGDYGAGIGGGHRGSGGTVTIDGGSVKATAGSHGAGIGGGMYGSGDTVTIHGGSVTATGGDYGAGIGGGYSGSGGTVTIYDGTITANGGFCAAGIGGGEGGSGGNITIHGGSVTAVGGNESAGIGGGHDGSGDTVTIHGGSVKATAGSHGAGIGGGKMCSGGTVTISGGSVTATGNGYGPGIGNGWNGSGGSFATGADGDALIIANGGISDKSQQGSWSGIIFEGDNGQVYGDQTLSGSLEVPSNKTLTVPENTTLMIPQGVTLTNNGTINNTGTIQNDGTIINNGTIQNNGVIRNNGSINGTPIVGNQPIGPVSYLTCDENGQNWTTESCTSYTLVESGTTTWSDGWYVVNGAVTIDSRVTVSGDVHLILADGASLNAKGGIGVVGGNRFSVYAQSTEGNMGTLTATGALNGYDGTSGIGGGYDEAIGTIVINGGIVTATGERDAAGIGGGYSGSGGKITINGGNVTATGYRGSYTGGAGIGSGYGCSDSCTVIINGGNVTANGGSYGAGIGGGYCTTGGTVIITGGSVTATGGDGAAGIGSGYQGGSGGSFATGIDGHALIIASSISDKSNKGSWSGIIFDGDDVGAYGNQTLSGNLEITGNQTLTVPEGSTLTVNSSVTLTCDTTLTNDGTIAGHGTLDGAGDLVGSGTVAETITNNLKKDSAVAVTVSSSPATYGSQVTITAKIAKAASTYTAAENQVEFFVGNVSLGTAAVNNNEASVTVTLSEEKGFAIGENTITAQYGGSMGLKPQTGTATLTIEKAAQAALQITDVTGKQYGDEPFTLTTTGGSGTGAVTFSVPDDNGVLTVSGNQATIVGAGTVRVTATKAEDAYYNPVTATLDITIAKALAPDISWPKASAITYGEKVVGSTLTGGSTQYGTFAWLDAIKDSVPEAGTASYSVVFTPSEETVQNYEPIATTAKYVFMTVNARSLTDAQVTVSGSYAYTGSPITPKVTVTRNDTQLAKDADYTLACENNTNAGTATVTVTGTGNYTGTVSTTFTIGKATPKPDTPTGLTAVYGDTLANVKLPTGWAWDAPETSVGNVGENSFDATYTQDNSGNYNPVKQNLTVKVTPAAYQLTLTGQPDSPIQITLNEAVVEPGNTGARVTYGCSTTNAAPDSWQAERVFSGLTADTTYYFFAKAEATQNHAETISQGVAITTPKKSMSKLEISHQPDDLSYTSGQALDLSGLSVNVSYDDNTSETILWDSGKLTADPAQGTVLRVAKHQGKTISVSYGGKTVETQALTVKKAAQAALSITGAPDKIYKGSSFNLELSGGSGEGAVTWQVVKGSATVDEKGTVTVRGTGKFQIQAVKAADAEYEQAEVVITLTAVNKPSSGGSDSQNKEDSTTTDRPDKDAPNTPTTGQTPPVKPEPNGNANIGSSTVQQAIDKATADAKKNGSTANGIALVVPVDMGGTPKDVQIILKAETLDKLVSSKVKRFTIDTDCMTDFGFEQDILKELNRQTSGDIVFKVKKTAPSSEEAKAAVGTRPAYDISLWEVKNGKETQLTDLNGKAISIAIPYTPAEDEQPGRLYAVSVDTAGKVQWITKSSCDGDQKAVIFHLTQPGIYAVGYDAQVPAFTDIENHWAEDNILFAVSRGLLDGTSETTFSPDSGMTRGMFATALGRLAGIDPDSYQTSKFTDVKADADYAPYVNWAASKGIMAGTSATTFAPDSTITREQMARIMKNYAARMGNTIPKTLEAVTFADNASISSKAKETVKFLQQAGILAGKTNNRFDPAATATRAEVATVLRRFVEIVIDPQTANGWVQNDSGEWSHYKNGELVKGWLESDQKRYWLDETTGKLFSDGWKRIDGKQYYFYADGSMAVNTTVDGYQVGTDGVRTN